MAKSQKNDQNMTLIVFVVAAAILFVSYKFVFSSYNEKKQTVNDEITALDAVIKDRDDKISREEETKKSIDTFKSTKEKVLASFPAGIEAEDDLLFCKELEDKLGMFLTTSATFSDPIIYFSDPGSSLVGFCKTNEYQFSCSYTSFKELLTAINTYGLRRSIKELSIQYDTGILTGNMTLNEYYVQGKGLEYKSPSVTGITPGNTNPFGTLEGLDETMKEILFGAN